MTQLNISRYSERYNPKYPDILYYNSVTGKKRIWCRITNLHDGLLCFLSKNDKKEHIINTRAIIELIRNPKEE